MKLRSNLDYPDLEGLGKLVGVIVSQRMKK